MAARPLNRRKKIVKRRKRFTRFEHEDFPHKLRPNWRKPKGIDNRVRRKFRSTKKMPQIGFKNNKKTRFVLQNGFREFVIKNEQDLEVLLMHNKAFCGVLAGSLGRKKRAKILERARELNVKVVNGKDKFVEEEKMREE